MASVDIDFDAKTATVTCKPGEALTREIVDAALRPDYGVTSFATAPPGR